MKIIEQLTIENFRGIRHGTLSGFGDLNILVGRNNSGKSSIPEALGLYADPEHMIPHVLTRRGDKGAVSIVSIFYNELVNNGVRVSEIHNEDMVDIFRLSVPFSDLKQINHTGLPGRSLFGLRCGVTRKNEKGKLDFFISQHNDHTEFLKDFSEIQNIIAPVLDEIHLNSEKMRKAVTL